MEYAPRSNAVNKLAARIEPGDHENFLALTDFMRGEMTRYAMTFLPATDPRRQDDADDIVQSTVERAYRAYQEGQVETINVRAWMMVSVRNRCLDLLRHRRVWRMESLDGTDAGHGQLPGRDEPVIEAIVRDEDANRVRRALAMTSPRNRLALVLREYEELPLDEIGRCLGYDDGAYSLVKSLLFRARHEIRGHYLSLLDQERIERAG